MTARAEATPAVTAAQMREVDRSMVDTYRISLLQMMELAGRTLAALVRARLGGIVCGQSVVVAAGTGYNGGGGLVAARHLANWGGAVTALVESEQEIRETPRRQWDALKLLPIDRRQGMGATEFFAHARATVVIDALIGYGLRGTPQGWTATMIDRINAQPAPVIALDIPSGLDATTGEPARSCIKAVATMTLALPKTGLLARAARPYVGDLHLADIGVPSTLYTRLGLDVAPIFRRGNPIRLEIRPTGAFQNAGA